MLTFKKKLLSFLFFLSFIGLTNTASFVTPLKSTEAVDRFLEAYDRSIILTYTLDSKIKDDETRHDRVKDITLKLEELLLSDEDEVSKMNIRIGSINLAHESMQRIKNDFRCIEKDNVCLFVFYRGNIIGQYELSGKTSRANISRFLKRTYTSHRFSNQRRNRKIHGRRRCHRRCSTYDRCDNCYSFPQCNFNFGVPFFDWPGYGRGWGCGGFGAGYWGGCGYGRGYCTRPCLGIGISLGC